jgi:hypothetical protein
LGHLLAILASYPRTSAVYSALRPSFISANQIRWPPNFVSVLSDHICCPQKHPLAQTRWFVLSFCVSHRPCPPPNRRWMSGDVLTPKVPRAGGFPKGPAPNPRPCVFCSLTLFSACSQHTGSPAFVWWVCRPLAIRTFQRHSTQHTAPPPLLAPFQFSLGSRVSKVAASLLPRPRLCACQSTQECPFRYCSTYWV